MTELSEYNELAKKAKWGLHSRLSGSDLALWEEIYEFNRDEMNSLVVTFCRTMDTLTPDDRLGLTDFFGNWNSFFSRPWTISSGTWQQISLSSILFSCSIRTFSSSQNYTKWLSLQKWSIPNLSACQAHQLRHMRKETINAPAPIVTVCATLAKMVIDKNVVGYCGSGFVDFIQPIFC